MTILIIIGTVICLAVILYFCEEYLYPICPLCGDNLNSKRSKGGLIKCNIHGLVNPALFKKDERRRNVG
jgi:hypothetical protein